MCEGMKKRRKNLIEFWNNPCKTERPTLQYDISKIYG